MKVTSKQADATLAKLTHAMQRNTTLATATAPTPASVGPVATYTAQPVKPITVSARSKRSGIRLNAHDNQKIGEVIQAGLALETTLAVSEVIHLALRAYDPKSLKAEDIRWLRTIDGRSQASKLVKEAAKQ